MPVSLPLGEGSWPGLVLVLLLLLLALMLALLLALMLALLLASLLALEVSRCLRPKMDLRGEGEGEGEADAEAEVGEGEGESETDGDWVPVLPLANAVAFLEGSRMAGALEVLLLMAREADAPDPPWQLPDALGSLPAAAAAAAAAAGELRVVASEDPSFWALLRLGA